MSVNLERGFRRITWVVSITLFALGASFVVISWLDALDQWNRAWEPLPDGPTNVFVLGFGTVQFPSGFTEASLKEALDRQEEQIKNKQLVLNLSDYIEPRPLISFVYLPSSKEAPSILYSRKTILQAETKGELTQEGQEALSKLRKDYGFPSPGEKPYTLGNWALYWGLALGVATVPWGVFYLVRWIVRGFRAG